MRIEKLTGLNNVASSPAKAGPGDFQVASNVLFLDDGSVMRRPGSALVYAGTPHSMFEVAGGALFVEGLALKLMDHEEAVTTLRALTSSEPMHYLDIDGTVCFSNGVDTGIYDQDGVRTWGVAVPPAPVVASVPGPLIHGTYRVALTYLCQDGQESGTSAPVACIVDQGGIELQVTPSSNPRVIGIVVYMTAVDGEIGADGSGLYRVGALTNAAATVSLKGAGTVGERPCRTFNMAPAPAATAMGFYRGRAYLLQGDTLWYSERVAYELFSLDRGHAPLGSRGAMFVPLENGIWVGTAKECFFLGGEDPLVAPGLQIKARIGYGAAPESYCKVDGAAVKLQGMGFGRYALWLTPDGWYAGDGNGFFRPLTSDKWVPPTIDGVTAFVDQRAGGAQLMFALRGADGAGNVALGFGVGA